MSFWNDLEEMQKEIENLDTPTASRLYNNQNSNDLPKETADSRIRELEEKAERLSKIIKVKSKNISPRHSKVQKNVDLCVKDATTSHSANIQLMHHLGALEDEIQKLTQKEDVWHETAKNIQNEVASLRNKIDRMKSGQRSDSISISKDRTNRINDHHNYIRYSNNNNVAERKQDTQRIDRIDRNNRTSTPSEISYRYEPTIRSQQRQQITSRNERNGKFRQKAQQNTNNGNHATENKNVTIYKFQRVQRENQQLMRENEILKNDLSKYTQKFATEKQKLKVRLNEKETQIINFKHELENKEYVLRNEHNRINDLQQQIVVLQQVAKDYDNVKDSHTKLQLDHQRALHDTVEARKDKSLIDQQLNAAKRHIHELEINCRENNHEKMGVLSEMRAMKQVSEQERKNVSDRYERITQKLEAELSYAKRMYQEIKRKYRDLQHRFESDQPQFEQLQEALNTEKDGFHTKLNDVVIEHVSNLDMISKQSNIAVQNTKWIEDVVTEDNCRFDDQNDLHNSQHRQMSSIWEPKLV